MIPSHRLTNLMAATLLALISASCSVLPVAAQMSPYHMELRSPDWGSGRGIFALVYFCLVMPCFLVSLFLLWRRRKSYPIAGRGAWFIIAFNVNSIYGTPLCLFAWMCFPDGMPCGLLVLQLWAFLPDACTMCMRGLLLMWRVEMMSYLAELSWRKSKIAQLQAAGLGKGKDAEREHARIASTSGDATLIRIQAADSTADPLALPSLEPKSIPGHMFISNRRLIAPRVVMAGAAVVGVGVTLLVALTGIFDPDIRLTDEWRAQRGLEPDDLSTHWGGNALIHAPRCLIYSIKLWSFVFAMFAVLPFIGLVAWRLWVNGRRMSRRLAEQAEFTHALAVYRHLEAANTAAAGGVAKAGAAPASHGTGSHAPTAELDELRDVKNEMGIVAIWGTSGMISAMLTIAFAYPYMVLTLLITHLTLWCSVVVPALWRSFEISQRHRDMLSRARVCPLPAHGKRGGTTKFVASIAHHRPYYRLQFVINDPTAYPVLLAFLQKEYSSENALFFLEAQRYARQCREMERTIPGFSSSLDGDDDHTTTEEKTGSTPAAAGAAPGSTLVTAHHRGVSQLASGTVVQRAEKSVRSAGGAGALARSLTPVIVPEEGASATTLPQTPSHQQMTLLSHNGSNGGIEMVPPMLPSPPPGASPTSDATGADPTGGAALAAGGSSPSLMNVQKRASHGASARAGGSSGGNVTAIAGQAPAVARKPLLLLRVDARSSSDGGGDSSLPGSVSSSPHPQPRMSPLLQQQQLMMHEAPINLGRSLVETSLTSPTSAGIAAAQAAAATGERSPSPMLSAQQPAAHDANAAANAAAAPRARWSFREMHERACAARAFALQLHADYLKPNAVFQVNIDSDLAKMVGEQCRQLEHEWRPTPLDSRGQPDFERAAMESAAPEPPPFPLSSLYKQTALSVFNLMETDSFRRFLLTADFQALLEAADKREMKRLEHQSSAGALDADMMLQADAALNRYQPDNNGGGGSSAGAVAASSAPAASGSKSRASGQGQGQGSAPEVGSPTAHHAAGHESPRMIIVSRGGGGLAGAGAPAGSLKLLDHVARGLTDSPHASQNRTSNTEPNTPAVHLPGRTLSDA